ncbi:MAG: penicillin-binding transpeptidase domain-containing protein [Desulfovibrionaceae bacterium]
MLRISPPKKQRNKRSASTNMAVNFKSVRGLGAWFTTVDWGRLRINIVAGIFVVLWFGLWGRAWYLQMIEGPTLAHKARRQHMTSELVAGKRGKIFDRNGQVLARSVECRSVYAKPGEITDVLHVANTLGPLLQIPPQELYNQLSDSNRKFLWLARKVDDHTAEAVRMAEFPGIGLSKEFDRIYPFKQMAGQLLGFVGMDDRGLEGIERSLDNQLASIPTRQIVQRDATGRRFYLHTEGQEEPGGKDLSLTVDVQVQFFAEEALAQTVEDYGATWGGVLVVDVPTGDILAWAQYPFFNPNSYREYAPSQYRNRLASDALEPGSTFKPFLVATALQEKKVDPDTLFDCEGGKWETKTITIRDTGARGILPVSKIVRYSSNIGMAKVGMVVGAKTYHKYLSQLGFGTRTGLPVAESRGILRNAKEWGEADLISTSFGQSISVTGIQMAQAYLTLLNGGVYKPLRLVLDENAAVQENYNRVFSERVSKQVLSMLRDVVEEDGSGKAARIQGMQVGGKTGTAQKADKRSGTYGRGRMASFVGFAPADNPHYLVLVMVDEPTRNQYGGVVAAPVFQKVTSRTMTYRGHMPNVVFAETTKAQQEAAKHKSRLQRGLKFSKDQHALRDTPLGAEVRVNLAANTTSPSVAKAAAVVPNVVGKSVRNAVELFARGGIVPILKGEGQHVVKQSPAPGAAWPTQERDDSYVLWLSER